MKNDFSDSNLQYGQMRLDEEMHKEIKVSGFIKYFSI